MSEPPDSAVTQHENKLPALDTALDRTAKFVALLVGVTVVVGALRTQSPFLAYWATWFDAFYAVTVGLGKQTGRRVHSVRRLLVGVLLLGALVLVSIQLWQKRLEIDAASARTEFEKLLATGCWIAYEPAAFNPYTQEFPSSSQILAELAVLADGGFNSIITFSSDASLGEIPRLAKGVGFKAVIMGIIDVTDPSELASAISARDYVDAYCVGHMFTDYPFSEADILDALSKVRKATRRPVTTTLRPNGYLVFPDVSRSIDFFFPDVHANWYSDGRAASALQATMDFVEETKKIQDRYPNKPVLLKLISLPSKEVAEACTEQQYWFYRKVVEFVESSMTFPERVYPSYFSAFDLHWKSPIKGWPAGERFLGFYDSSGAPKTAMLEGHLTRVVDALHWSRTSRTARSTESDTTQGVR